MRRWVGRVAGLALAVAAAFFLWPRGLARAPGRGGGPVPVAGGGSAPAPPQVEETPVPAWLAGTGRLRRIAGRVTADGQPVAGAAVRLASRAAQMAGAPVREQTTRTDGGFDFGEQATTGYTLAAHAEGRTDAVLAFDLDDLRLAADALELVLRPCDADLHGAVRDASGAPVRAQVHRLEKAAFTVATDAGGRYRVCLPDGPVALVVEADGFGSEVVHVEGAGASRRDIALAAALTVTGRCVDGADGRPVAGAVVAVGPSFVLSGADGRFRVPGVSPRAESAWGLAAAARGYAQSNATKDATLVFPPTSRIVGTVVAHGQPVAGVEVSTGFLRDSTGGWPAFSQEDGSFALERVPRGPQGLLVAGHVVMSPTALTVELPVHEGVVIEIEDTAVIRGRVLRGGRPVAGAEVTCAGPKAQWKPVRSGADGAYVCDGLSGGTYAVSAEDEAGGAFGDDVQVKIGPGAERVVDVELGHSASIAGLLVDAEGRPVAGRYLRFLSKELGDVSAGTTDADGRFVVTELAGGGTYDAEVRDVPAFQSFPRVVVPRADSHVEGVRLVLVADRTLRGQVLDARGAPAPGARVAVAERLDSAAPLGEATTGDDGRWAIERIGCSSCVVRARGADGSEGVFVGPGPSSVVDLRLGPPVSLEGKLVGFGPRPGGVVHLDPEVPGAVHVVDDQLWAQGLAPGTYLVSVLRADAVGAAEAVVPATGAARVVLERRQPAWLVATGRPGGTELCVVGLRVGSRWRPADAARLEWRVRGKLAVPSGEIMVECDGRAIPLALEPGSTTPIDLDAFR
jgi:hypothetical protein